MLVLALLPATGVTAPHHVLSKFFSSEIFFTAVDGLGSKSKIYAIHVVSSSRL